MALINSIIGLLLIVVVSFAVISGLVAGYFLFYALFACREEKIKDTIDGVNPVLGAFLKTWIGTRHTIDDILKWDLGIWLLTMFVVSLAIIIVLVWDSFFKSWTLALLLIGSAIQVIVGLYILSKVGIRTASTVWSAITSAPRWIISHLAWGKCQNCGCWSGKSALYQWTDSSTGSEWMVCPKCMQEWDKKEETDRIMEQLKKESGCTNYSMLSWAASDVINGKVTIADAVASLKEQQARINKICEDNLDDDQKNLVRWVTNS